MAQPIGQKALSHPLQHDLALYALAAGAAGVGVLALTQSAGAEVIYTPVNQTINAHQGYAIDLNHDGIVDFRIQNIFKRQFAFGFPYISDIGLMVVPVDGVQAGNSQYEVAALPAGAAIGPVQPPKPWGLRGAAMAYQFRDGSFGTYYFGSWLNVSNRYLGLAFNIDGETHFGWVRLTVHWNHKWTLSADITGYAYETVPNKPIIAGDMGAGIADSNSVEPTGEMFAQRAPEAKPATLGALALGAGGLAIWRRP
ncbi:MAG: hypothetical protein WAM04_09140 [Candidatus Sulfotelmatobacter sp.]